ncbi:MULTISPECIES: hypothetical protein [Natrialbaceae]|nr:hypothetical protein [Natronococcus sp. CG52]
MPQTDNESSTNERVLGIDPTSRETREQIAGIGFALPYLVIAGGFLFGPLLLGLYMSFHDWNATTPA